MKTFVLIYAISAGVIAFYGMMLFLFRKKIADWLCKLDEPKRIKFFQSSQKIVGWLRILLWMSPLSLIFCPLAVYFYLGQDWFIYLSIAMLSMYISILPMFFTRKWLLRHFGW